MDIPSLSNIISHIKLENSPISQEDRLYIFGRNPELSLAELISLYHAKNEIPQVKELTPIGVILGLKKAKTDERQKGIESKNHASINDCGSVLKRCRPIATFSKDLDDETFISKIEQYFQSIFLNEKLTWTISEYNCPDSADSSIYDQIYHNVKLVLKKIKIRKAMFTKPESGRTLNPQKAQRRSLIEDGFELILWHQANSFILAHTEEIIDIDALSDRDKNRPFTRPLLLLGLALARSMVNLIHFEQNQGKPMIYDPFCGMGSIVQEAHLLGYPAIGSDIDGQCVNQSRGNLTWIAKEFEIRPLPSDAFFVMDITNPDKARFTNFEGSIVSEPDLSTPLEEYPTTAEANKLISQFSEKFNAYLSGFSKILSQNSMAVFIFPQLHTKDNRRISLNLEDLMERNGFMLCETKINNISFPATFIHQWKNPIIERQILVFKKKQIL